MRREALLNATWRLGTAVLMQLPATGDDDPAPIENAKKVKVFATVADCESYRARAMQDSALLSDAMLQEVSSLKCVAGDDQGNPTK